MTPSVAFGPLWPVLAPALAAVLVLVLDVAVPQARRTHLVVAALGLAGGAVATGPGLGAGSAARETFCVVPGGSCLYSAGSLTSGLQLLALGSALVVLVLTWADWDRPDDEAGGGRTAVLTALLLAATAGVVAVPAAGDLATLLVALELATLPTVALVALERARARHARAITAAVSLLTTSLVSFALLALGAALWVAATGTALLSATRAADAVDAGRGPLLVLAAVLALAGLGFKLSAVPFHAWTPITYTGAPLPVTVYLAATSKVAALGGLVVLVQALAGAAVVTVVAIGVVAALSMTVGNVRALREHDLVRLLAWSAVAQAGWVMLPLAAVSARSGRAAAGYLVVYAVATLAAFVAVVLVAALPARGVRLEHHRALARSHPLVAAALTLALLTLAGLPPAVVGLVAKVVALRPVAGEGLWWLAVVAALNVALGIAVYLRWVAVLLERPPTDAEQAETAPDEPGPRVRGRVRHRVLLGVLTALLVAGSLAPVGIF